MAIASINRQRLPFMVLGIILLLAFALRFYHLGTRPLYGDERFNTVEFAQKPVSYLLVTNYGSILYPLLLHFILPLGNTEVVARLLSAILGFFAAWGIFLIGKRILSPKEGLIAAFFGAVSTHFILFSQQARGYSGLLFFSVFALYFYWRALEEDKVGLWFLYALSMIIGAYMHFFLLVLFPIHVLFVIFRAIERKIPKKTFLAFFISALSIGILTFLLYWPTRGVNPNDASAVNFYPLLKGSLSRLLGSGRNVRLVSFSWETLRRQLDFYVWPLYFYVKIAFVLLGLFFCLRLRSERRQGFFLMACVIVPFVLFFLSNPPGVYWTAQDNKFIFILPMLYLLMARGLTGVYGAAARALKKLGSAATAGALKKALSGLLIAGTLFGEGVGLSNYNFFFWNLRALEIGRDVRAHLRKSVAGTEMIFSEDYLGLAETILAKDIAPPEIEKKIVMIFEAEYIEFEGFLSQNLGLWLILRRSPERDKIIPSLLATSPGADVKIFSRHSLVHLPSSQFPVREKLALAVEYLTDVPCPREKKIEYGLLSAKLDLCAGRIPEALTEIESAERLRNQSPETQDRQEDRSTTQRTKVLLFPKRITSDDHVQDKLSRQLVDLLVSNAEKSLGAGRIEEAFSALNAAEALSPASCESSIWFHMLSAEIYRRKGAKAEVIREYRQALPLCGDENSVISVLKKMRQDLALPSGLALWQQKNVYNLVWWGENKSIFEGALSSSRPITEVRTFHFTANDAYHRQEQAIIFKGVVKDGRFEGLTFRTKKNSRLTYTLKIDGQKDSGERVIILLDEGRPVVR